MYIISSLTAHITYITTIFYKDKLVKKSFGQFDRGGFWL